MWVLSGDSLLRPGAGPAHQVGSTLGDRLLEPPPPVNLTQSAQAPTLLGATAQPWILVGEWLRCQGVGSHEEAVVAHALGAANWCPASVAFSLIGSSPGCVWGAWPPAQDE